MGMRRARRLGVDVAEVAAIPPATRRARVKVWSQDRLASLFVIQTAQ